MPSRRRTMKRGGAGAAEWGVNAYGSAGSQHAVGNGSNVIAIAPLVKGGSRRRRGQKGGIGITEVAVPAALLITNELVKRRRAKKGGSRKTHRKH